MASHAATGKSLGNLQEQSKTIGRYVAKGDKA